MDSKCSHSLIAGPLSASMISEIHTAYTMAKKLYPSWKSLEHTKQIHNSLLAEKLSWTRYRQTFASVQAPDGLIVSFSLSELAKAGEIDSDSFKMYLDLLRGSARRVTVTKVVGKGEHEAFVSTLDPSKAWIIPVQHEHGWSFSVLRSGNKHWYEGGLISAPANISERSSTQTQHDRSAAYVLLGIRLLAQGLPQVDLEDFGTLSNSLANWCTRLLVELSCRRLDPDDASVSEQYHKIEQYYDTEQEGDSELAQYCREVAGFTGENLPPNAYASASAMRRSLPRNTNMPPSRASRSPLSNTSTSSSTSVNSPSSSPLPDMATTEDDIDMKNILAILSSAALAVRTFGPNTKSYEVLLDILSQERIDPCFHLRRCKQQLYSKFIEEGLDGDRSSEDSSSGHDMVGVNSESLRREAKQWERIRDWCNRKCVSESSILCAIPKSEAWNCAGLEKLCDRLMDDEDRLGDLLKKAGELCDAIIACDLPPHLLPVEVFRGKENNACRFWFHSVLFILRSSAG
ncbi:hypothetical protein QL093DRAFT_2073536 [Fusarium oxysporum]|nr:hypothetical protein QL093DRAFT_2073536 [Fusarium oxysporum]